MKNYQIGLIILVIIIITNVLNYSYDTAFNRLKDTQCCSLESSCPSHANLEVQKIFNLILTVIVVGISAYFISADYLRARFYLTKTRIAISSEERKIYDYLREHDSKAEQSELIRAFGISKVKMTRVLNHLETKGVIERKRSGLGNTIELKTKINT